MLLFKIILKGCEKTCTQFFPFFLCSHLNASLFRLRWGCKPVLAVWEVFWLSLQRSKYENNHPSSDDLDSAKTATCRTTVHWRAGRHQWVDGDVHLDLGSGSRKTSLSHCRHLPLPDTRGVSTSRPPHSSDLVNKLSVHQVTAMPAAPSLGKWPIKAGAKFEITEAFPSFACARQRISVKMHSTESRFVIGL